MSERPFDLSVRPAHKLCPLRAPAVASGCGYLVSKSPPAFVDGSCSDFAALLRRTGNLRDAPGRLALTQTPSESGAVGRAVDQIRVQRGWLTAIVTTWSIGVLGGIALLSSYAYRPGWFGPPSIVAANDAVDAAEEPAWRLKLFIHPRCPCSRATLVELARLTTELRQPVLITVSFFRPAEYEESWARTELRRTAEQIPGVRIELDEGGRAARHHGATHSGHALLFDPRGRLRFSGGITAGRGHEGPNAGSHAIRSLLGGETAVLDSAPVFGCPLQEVMESRG